MWTVQTFRLVGGRKCFVWWEPALNFRQELQLNHGPPPSLLPARSLIVPRLTGHSQPVMEMSYVGEVGLHGVGN